MIICGKVTVIQKTWGNERENDCTLFTLGFFQSCFHPGKRHASPVNCLLTWAYNAADGLGWAGHERDGGGRHRQVYIKKNALISMFAEGVWV